jgi:hypothetical protein
MPVSEINAADDAAIELLVKNARGDVSGMRQCLYVDSNVIIFPSNDDESTIIVRSYDPIATVFVTVLATIFGCVAFYLFSFASGRKDQ